jgi:hypothetical protein
MKNTIEVEILGDGTIKILTGDYDPAMHKSADDFLKCMAQLAGGESTRTKRTDAQRHGHVHGQAKVRQ